MDEEPEEEETTTIRPKRSHAAPANYNPATGRSYAQDEKTTGVADETTGVANNKTTGVAEEKTTGVATKMFKTSKECMRNARLRREMCHNLVSEQVHEMRKDEYSLRTAKIIARTIGSFRENISNSASSHAQQFMLKRGLKKFGAKGKSAAME